jgi:hypothetical protein
VVKLPGAPRAKLCYKAFPVSSRPLLEDGRVADLARAALDALSRKLAALTPADLRGPSLAGGQSGVALAHAYLAPLFPRRAHAEGMQAMIESAMDAIASGPAAPSLHSGFVGLSWLVQHLRGADDALREDEDPNATIDAELAQWLDHSPWTQPFDLIEGLVGLGIYGLERMPVASGKVILTKVVDRLEDAADAQPKGLAWPTLAEWIPEAYRGDRPARYFDVGLAHGQAGVLGVLGAIAASGAAGLPAKTAEKAETLLDKGMAWMLAQRLPENPLSRFPTWVLPGKTPEPARDAWCYGDPGIAVALLNAARAVKSKKWETAALDVARHAARRDPKTTRCIDAGLCHGSFGNAQIFLRLYRMTGDRLFADRARFFVEHGLRQRKVASKIAKKSGKIAKKAPKRSPTSTTGPSQGASQDLSQGLSQARGPGFAGFFAYDVGPEMKPGWAADASYLTGGAGIALALAAALSPAEDDPGWDRIMLMSTQALTPSPA